MAHGMFEPSSNPNSIDDKDVMGVVLNPIEDYFGLAQTLGKRGVHEKFIGEWDVVAYEIRKYVSLLEKSNPNVLGLLWLRPEYYINIAPEGQRLIDSREIFVSKKIYHSFTGYAYSQLKRMENARFEGYMGEKRKTLVEKHGYDTKNAAHCIRLLRMGIEFLNEGVLHVFREDAQNLLSIKHGEWEIERVKAEAERLMHRAEDAYDRSTLPPEPDRSKINALLVDILKGEFLC